MKGAKEQVSLVSFGVRKEGGALGLPAARRPIATAFHLARSQSKHKQARASLRPRRRCAVPHFARHTSHS